MKILVALKQVADPDHSTRIGIAPDGRNIDATALEKKVNPFDEYALEAALRLTENGEQPKQDWAKSSSSRSDHRTRKRC
ncbi:MAG: hypothetical protein QM784_15910 [Polyangiaceae bacterium]